MRRAGFSLLELLVWVVVVAILAGLLLGAVQRIRDASSRSHTRNNLRQLALAAQNFASAHTGRMPASGVTRYEGAGILFYDLLPHMEEEPLYREFLVQAGKIIPPTTGGPAAAVSCYVNSADRSLPGKVHEGKGCASYMGNPALFGDGTTTAVLSDGAAMTSAFSERIMLCRGTPNPWFAAAPEFTQFGAAPTLENFAPGAQTCEPDRPSTPHHSIQVAMFDGSAHSFSPAGALKWWVYAADPMDGNPLEWE
jgi:type II secretory pathway pseudopilin PulG